MTPKQNMERIARKYADEAMTQRSRRYYGVCQQSYSPPDACNYSVSLVQDDGKNSGGVLHILTVSRNLSRAVAQLIADSLNLKVEQSAMTFSEFVLTHYRRGGNAVRADFIFDAQYGRFPDVQTFDDLYQYMKRQNRKEGGSGVAAEWAMEAASLWIKYEKFEYDKKSGRSFYPAKTSPEEFFGTTT